MASAYALLAGFPAPLAQWFELANWTFNLAAGVLIAIGLAQVWLARRKMVEDGRLTTTLVGFDLLIDSIAFQIAAVLPAAPSPRRCNTLRTARSRYCCRCDR